MDFNEGRKRRQMREQIAEINQNNENPNRLPNAQGRPQQNVMTLFDELYLNEYSKAANFLKKEELDGYFPIKNFIDMKTSFDQTS